MPTQQILGRGNHGKKSSKHNQDCTICRTCRQAMSDSAGLEQRENGPEQRE